MFPRGLPSEFALVLTLLMKKHTHQNTWYLFQVTDGDGYPQVSLAPRLLHPRCSWVSSGTSPAQLLSQLVILEPPCSTPVPTLEATRSPPTPFCWKVFLSDPSQLSLLCGLSFPSCEMSGRALTFVRLWLTGL